jgi:hypothetical protein
MQWRFCHLLNQYFGTRVTLGAELIEMLQYLLNFTPTAPKSSQHRAVTATKKRKFSNENDNIPSLKSGILSVAQQECMIFWKSTRNR